METTNELTQRLEAIKAKAIKDINDAIEAATVIKDDKVVVNGYEVVYIEECASVNGITLHESNWEKLSQIATNCQEIKTILEGFNK